MDTQFCGGTGSVSGMFFEGLHDGITFGVG